MDRLLRFIGFLTCIVGILYGASWLIQHFPKYVEPTLQGLGVVALLALFVRLYLGRDWLMKLGKEFVIGSDLIKASENFLNDLPKPKNETTANFIGHLVYRFTRLGLIGLMLALIPITLLYQQNQLLFTQNERFDIQNELITQQNELVTQQNQLATRQNKRLDQQTYLQEAERRSSLVFLFSNIMDAVDKELKDDYSGDDIRNLSPQLVGRIVALSTRLKPYRYLDGDVLTVKPLSPERGQLLVSLLSSDLDSLTMKEIFLKADFRYADLEGANLVRAYLNGVNLEGADLRNATLINASLVGANLYGADAEGADLSNTNLNNADLRHANGYSSNFSSADLMRTDFSYAWLAFTDFRKSRLANTSFGSSILHEADFREAEFMNTYMEDFDMGYLKRMREKDGSIAELPMEFVFVDSNFLEKIQNLGRDSIIGTSYIVKNYKMEKGEQTGEQDRYWLISKNRVW